ncbi:Gti1/Pac2 family-domain-containing protein, partial [Flammula alnicola]
SSSTWTEPPWSGWIETTGDALLILEAARRGLIPRVTRRLVDAERRMITSGSVFVFDEDESGIKRWTDGFFWSPSRILGNFLLYRETDKRGAGHRSARADQEANEPANFPADGPRDEGQSLSRPKSDNTGMSVDKQRERTLMGSLTNSYKFKPDGLMKKTFSVTIGGVAQHLISYYKIEDVENGRLRSPSSLPELAALDISPEYLDKTHFRNPPKVEIGVDGVPRYRGEADDIESSPSILTTPLSSDMPLLTEGRATETSSSKRGKRYDPYGSPPAAKRSRRNTKSSQPDGSTTPTAEPVSPQGSASSATPQPVAAPPPTAPAYPEPNVPLNMASAPPPPLPGPYPPYGMHPFYSMPGYPPPPGHMYAGPHIGLHPSSADPSQQTGHGPPPQPYYQYYAPPPPGLQYSYQWPVYSGFPPQPQPVQ